MTLARKQVSRDVWHRLLALATVSSLLAGCATPPTTGGSPSMPAPPSGGTAGGITTPSSPGGWPRPASTPPGAPSGDSRSETDPGSDADPDARADAGTDTDVGTDADADTAAEIEGDVATTADERREILARRLDQSLGDFDATLDEEQRRTAAERDARAASAASAMGQGRETSEGGARSGDLRSERERREGVVAGAASSTAGTPGSGGARDRGVVGGGSGAPDRGIPSGDDDDIVARRLRRAAEQETDPELKEKLWQEYIEYKRNARG